MSGPTLAGAGAILLWAFLAVLTRGAANVPPFGLMAGCFAISGAGGIGWLALRGRLAEVRQPPLAWLHGVGGLFGYHALYFAALRLAPAAQANLLNYCWPLLIVLLSAVLLGLPLRAGHWAGLALGVAGCGLLLSGAAEFTPADGLGYALALGSALVWALYSVASRWFLSVPTGALAGFCVATAVLAAVCHLVFETPTPIQTVAEGALLLLLGAGPLGGAFYLWDIGMKRGDPRLLGTLAYATPVLSTVLLIAAGFAPFTLATVAAAALVGAGGLIAARRASPTARPDQAGS